MQDMECIRKGQARRLKNPRGYTSSASHWPAEYPALPPAAAGRGVDLPGQPGEPRDGYYRDLYLLWLACGMLRLADWAGAGGRGPAAVVRR